MFNGIIQTILVAFSTKTSKAWTGMLSFEKDAFKFLIAAQSIKARASRAPYFRGSLNCLISQNRSAIDQIHERESGHRALLYDWRESCLLIGPICLHKSLCLPGNWS